MAMINIIYWTAVCIACCYADKDFYEVLNIEKDASAAQIKKAFHKLSLKLHPDKNKDDENASKRFAEVANAYDVLSDPDKRRQYDLYGEEGLKDNHGGGGHDPSDIFSQFFGGGFGGRRGGGRQEQNRGPDVLIPLRVTLAELYTGRTLSFNIRRRIICPHCRGSGAKDSEDVKTCTECGGQGIKLHTRRLGPGFVQQFQTTCDKCGGKGKVQTSTCDVCGGEKVVFGDFEYDVVVEKGMPDGFVIEYENYADEHPEHTAGDVQLLITTLPHDYFIRDGDDLEMDMTITLQESLVGFTKTFTHLDGRTVTVKRDKVTKPRQIITLKNEGMPMHSYSSEKGKLKIKFQVVFPEKLSQEQKDGFRELFKDL